MDDNSYNEILELFLKAVESVKSSGYDAYTEDAKKGLVPVGISNHHVHFPCRDIICLQIFFRGGNRTRV